MCAAGVFFYDWDQGNEEGNLLSFPILRAQGHQGGSARFSSLRLPIIKISEKNKMAL